MPNMPTGIPISPFPTMLKCFGLSIQESKFKIHEGFVRMAFDYAVDPIDESCFFTIFERDISSSIFRRI